MEVFRFERAGKVITSHGSSGLRGTRIAAGHGEMVVTCLAVEPGGVIGTHPATAAQLFMVTAGEGWVAGQDGRRATVAHSRWAANTRQVDLWDVLGEVLSWFADLLAPLSEHLVHRRAGHAFASGPVSVPMRR